MKIEHVAFQVADPGAMGDWYVEHMGFQISRAADAPVPVRFLADETGKVMLEVYHNSEFPVPDYATMPPALVHVAFVCEDVPGVRERLMAAGATAVGEVEQLASGDEVAMLRDPWGLAIQLVRRVEAMV